MIFQAQALQIAHFTATTYVTNCRTQAAQMLDEWLVACANNSGRMRSLGVWTGENGEAEEAGVLLKTEPHCMSMLPSGLRGCIRAPGSGI